MNHDHEINGPNTARDAAFDTQLHTAMRRVKAPETLAKFLLLAAEAETQRSQHGGVAAVKLSTGGKVLALPKPPLWAAGAMAALLLLTASIGEGVHLRHEHERAEATRQFDEATRITDQALAHTREQLRRAGVSVDE
jgi:hypothetical protein